MLTQHKAQLDARDKNPGMVRPAQNPYAVRAFSCTGFPKRRTLHRLRRAVVLAVLRSAGSWKTPLHDEMGHEPITQQTKR